MKFMKTFENVINEYVLNTYTVLEFVCYNSTMEDSTDKQKLMKFYQELKEISKSGDIYPYMQDFSDERTEQYFLSVVILNKDNESQLQNQIIELGNKYHVEFDLSSKKPYDKVNKIINGTYYNNLI